MRFDKQEVKKAIAHHFSVNEEEVKSNSNFSLDLQADSLDSIEMVMMLEERFDIEVPDETVETLKTVQDVFNYLASQPEVE